MVPDRELTRRVTKLPDIARPVVLQKTLDRAQG